MTELEAALDARCEECGERWDLRSVAAGPDEPAVPEPAQVLAGQLVMPLDEGAA